MGAARACAENCSLGGTDCEWEANGAKVNKAVSESVAKCEGRRIACENRAQRKVDLLIL